MMKDLFYAAMALGVVVVPIAVSWFLFARGSPARARERSAHKLRK